MCIGGDEGKGRAAAGRKSRATRDLILKAAARHFRDKGYAASTLKEIAAAAGIEAGSIYYHFTSKEDLLDDVFDLGCRQVIEAVSLAKRDSEAGNSGFRRTLEAMIYAHLHQILEASDFTAANMRNFSMLPPEAQTRHRAAFEVYGNIWFDLFEKALEKGELRDDIDILSLQRLVIGALNFSVEWFNSERFSVKKFAEDAAALLLHGLLSQTGNWQEVDLADLSIKPMSTLGAGQAKADQTRLQILISTARVLRERGYDGVTLRQIAEAAGIEAGSIYYHFPSKEKIIDEVLSRGLHEINDGVTTVLEKEEEFANHGSRIAAAIRAHMMYLFVRNDFVVMNIRIYSQLPFEVQQRHRPIRQQYASSWSKSLQRAQASGEFRSDLDAVPMRQLLLGALNWTANWFNPERDRKLDSRTLDELINLILHVFLDGIAAKDEDTVL